MHLISATPGSSSAELARHTHVTPQTMHKLMADLEQRGLLTLHPRAGHGRILDAHLTDQGRQVMADADERAKAIEGRMVAGLDKQQRTQLSDLLQHCVTALDTPADPTPTPKPLASPGVPGGEPTRRFAAAQLVAEVTQLTGSGLVLTAPPSMESPAEPRTCVGRTTETA